MKKSLVTILILMNLTVVHAQKDTLFYFVVPEVADLAGFTQVLDRPVHLQIASYSQPAVVTISQPANPSFPLQTINIPADTAYTFNLTPWINSLENSPGDVILNSGLNIQSTSLITAYYEVNSQCFCNPEIFVLKGQSAFGNDFWIPSQNFIDNTQGFWPVSYSAFDIVATQNNTSVTITPSHDIIGHTADSTFTINLNEGQTYCAKAISHLASQHLNGSRVISDNPVAITIKDDGINGGLVYGGICADLGGDQIVPTSMLGMDYIAINSFLSPPGDQLFVLATIDTTIIFQNGFPVDTINAGETRQYDVGDSSTFIHTTHPTSVLQLSGIGCETGLEILPPINCTATDSIRINRSTWEFYYVNLLVPNGGQNNFLVNGITGIINDSIFKQVPGTNGQWLSGQYSINTSLLLPYYSVSITNPSTFYISVIHGDSTTGARFGHFSGFSCPVFSGINELNTSQEMLLYPNPATNDFTVETGDNSELFNLAVYDTYGKLVFAKTNLHSGYRVSTTNWAHGLYSVVVQKGSKATTLRMVILMQP